MRSVDGDQVVYRLISQRDTPTLPVFVDVHPSHLGVHVTR